MNAIDRFGFASQERALLQPPCLTARQEYIATLYTRLSEIEDELTRQLDRRACIHERLRNAGETV